MSRVGSQNTTHVRDKRRGGSDFFSLPCTGAPLVWSKGKEVRTFSTGKVTKDSRKVL